MEVGLLCGDGPSLKANSSAAVQEIPDSFCNLKVLYLFLFYNISHGLKQNSTTRVNVIIGSIAGYTDTSGVQHENTFILNTSFKKHRS
jgi:hypothetical protein